MKGCEDIGSWAGRPRAADRNVACPSNRFIRPSESRTPAGRSKSIERTGNGRLRAV